MNVQLPVQMDKAAFLAWSQDREGRYELTNGRVVMMVGASRTHGLIVRNLVVLLHGQLDPQRWVVLSEFGLDLSPQTLRYPDIVVDKAGGKGSDYTTASPALLVEVLSPSTVKIDLGDKAAEYLRLPSLHAYIVFAQDEPKAWLWNRDAADFLAYPAVVVGYDKIIYLKDLQLTLPLGAVYAGAEPDRN